MANNNTLTALIPRMANKLKEDRGLTYRICAVAFTKRNNVLGLAMNSFRDHLSTRKGAGSHAEAKLIKKYGKRIDRIYILRVGNACDPLPIHPCANCSKLAEKYGIRIIPLHEEFTNLTEYIKK
jgi:hypothetical protein